MLVSLVVGSANAAIVNGDFSASGAGYETVLDGGSVVFDGSTATLATGSGVAPFSASLIQGDDGTLAFASAIDVPLTALFLTFDLVSVSQEVASDETAGTFTDNLVFSIFDSADSAFDIILPGFDANAVLGTISIDIFSLRGRSVAFFFDLFDENDGFDTTFVVDNLSFELASVDPVPVPAAFGFGLLVAGFAGWVRRWSVFRRFTAV